MQQCKLTLIAPSRQLLLRGCECVAHTAQVLTQRCRFLPRLLTLAALRFQLLFRIPDLCIVARIRVSCRSRRNCKLMNPLCSGTAGTRQCSRHCRMHDDNVADRVGAIVRTQRWAQTLADVKESCRHLSNQLRDARLEVGDVGAGGAQLAVQPLHVPRTVGQLSLDAVQLTLRQAPKADCKYTSVYISMSSHCTSRDLSTSCILHPPARSGAAE